MKILAVNPGSTSTKVAYYCDGQMIENQNILHQSVRLKKYDQVMDQISFRKKIILDFLKEKKIEQKDLDAIVGRGGILPPVEAGAYQVNERMKHYLQYETTVEHPSNLGALLADELLLNEQGIAMIYDPVSVDEFNPISRISGLKGIERKSIGHALNMRAVALRLCTDQGISYTQATVIIAHLGGGNSISIHHKGRMIDSISDDEGPFSTERTGGLPLKEVIHLCAMRSEKEMLRLYKREGGLKSYAGTNDMRKIEAAIEKGDQELAVIYEAYIYQISKGIASLAIATDGSVDGIALTGGVAYSEKIVAGIKKRVAFVAPVWVYQGEYEMLALCKGAERVLSGKEKMHEFS